MSDWSESNSSDDNEFARKKYSLMTLLFFKYNFKKEFFQQFISHLNIVCELSVGLGVLFQAMRHSMTITQA